MLAIRIRLIEQWRSIWRMWSVRFTTIGVLLLGYITASPDIIISAWAALPDELKQYIPPKYLLYVNITLFVLGVISRGIKQESIPKPGGSNGTL